MVVAHEGQEDVVDDLDQGLVGHGRPSCSRPRTGLAQMDAGCGAGACSTWGAAAVPPWLARYSAIVRSRP
jgi:hypothetical protein